MITGYNHNIPHNGRTYHVQTEDSGLQYKHIITHLFVGGNIIHSKKRSYAHLVEENLQEDEEEFEKVIRAMMQEQHKEMIKELRKGEHDHVGTRKSSGSLLTPGFLTLDAKAEEGVDAMPLADKPSEDLVLPVNAFKADELPDTGGLALPKPPPEEQVSASEPAIGATEEAAPGDDGASKRRSRGRLGRARPKFAAPPPDTKHPTMPTPAEAFAQKAADTDATLLDIRAFGHDFPVPEKETPSSSAPAPSRRRSRGSGRHNRPSLELTPPSPPSMSPLAPGAETNESPIYYPEANTEEDLPALGHDDYEAAGPLIKEAASEWLSISGGPANPSDDVSSSDWQLETNVSVKHGNTPAPRTSSSDASRTQLQKNAALLLSEDEHT
jgi:hypothetical protein